MQFSIKTPTLNMKASVLFKMFVPLYQTTLHHISENHNKNTKFHMFMKDLLLGVRLSVFYENKGARQSNESRTSDLDITINELTNFTSKMSTIFWDLMADSPVEVH
jgi:hypothetical protein